MECAGRLREGMMVAILVGLSSGMVHAALSSPFAYEFRSTPMDGPPDPSIEKAYTSHFKACQARAVATRDNLACIAAEFARQDKALNRTWRMLLARTRPQVRAALVQAQRRWVAERDPYCRSEVEAFRGGSIAPVVLSSCRVEQTIRRTLWLEQRP